MVQARDAIAQGLRETLDRDLPDLDLIADVALTMVNGIVLSHKLERDPARLERQFRQLRETFALAVLAAVQKGEKA